MDPLVLSVAGILAVIGIVALFAGAKSGLLAIIVATLLVTDTLNQQYSHITVGELPIAYFGFGVFALLFISVTYGAALHRQGKKKL